VIKMKREMKRKPRAKAMLPQIKSLIALRALTDVDKETGKRTHRTILAIKLVEEIKEKYPKEIAPSEDTLEKKISEVRNQERDPRDNPWYMHTLVDYPISAEAIGHIIDIQKLPPHDIILPVLEGNTILKPIDIDNQKGLIVLKMEDGKQYLSSPLSDKEIPLQGELILRGSDGTKYRAIGMALPFPVSIRRALWIDKLHAIKSLKNAATLSLASFIYSKAEMLSDIAQIPFNSSELDAIIRQDKPEEGLSTYLQRFTKEELQELYKYMAGYTSISKRKVKANEGQHNKAV